MSITTNDQFVFQETILIICIFISAYNLQNMHRYLLLGGLVEIYRIDHRCFVAVGDDGTC